MKSMSFAQRLDRIGELLTYARRGDPSEVPEYNVYGDSEGVETVSVGSVANIIHVLVRYGDK